MSNERTVTFPDGHTVPALGQGTWFMGESPHRAAAEVRALQAGIDAGLTLVDTAEMYANGTAEEIVGRAIQGRRDRVFLVSKVLPGNASRRGVARACEASLRRLGVDRIDLYLLHWRGPHPLADTIEAFEQLVDQGKIARWGVSNLDAKEMQEVAGLPHGDRVQTDQVLYNLGRRGIEFDLLPWCQERGIPIMAYSPIEQGRLLHDPTLKQIGERHGIAPAAVALAWVLRQPGVIAIPKTASPDHLRQNLACLDVRLDDRDLAELDQAFPPPKRRRPLEML
ncbi:aldo/keto reductase [Bordetella bronchialis]|uniref:Oxidoreductase n=1 Tax=Bordetella bronchialis TaxID=463025 RepID=A0ABM6CRM1_9BORD|nr:aldo/keto reductase [Bordetella bronchialis]ANN66652.1 oxidoreductase [Bordetella bronchialis]